MMTKPLNLSHTLKYYIFPSSFIVYTIYGMLKEICIYPLFNKSFYKIIKSTLVLRANQGAPESSSGIYFEFNFDFVPLIFRNYTCIENVFLDSSSNSRKLVWNIFEFNFFIGRLIFYFAFLLYVQICLFQKTCKF